MIPTSHTTPTTPATHSSQATLAPLEERSLPGLLEQRARSTGDRPFLRDAAGSLSFATAWDEVRTVAGGLRDLGVGPGDRVAVLLTRPRETVLTWLGTAALGAVEVPLDPELSGDRLHYLLAHSGAVLVVVDGQLVSHLDELADRLPALRHTPFDALLRAKPIAATAVEPAQPTALLYTSGSTGPPKAATVPHGQHYMNAFQAVRAAGIEATDTLFLALPLHHNMAQGYAVAPALLAGACVQLAGRFDRRTFWDQVAASGATVFPFVGAMLALLASQNQTPPAHRLRVGYGIPVTPALHEEFGRRFGVRLVHCYGSTEATIVTWAGVDADHDAAPGSCGWAVPEFLVQVHDDQGRPVPTGVTGEVCVRPLEPASMFLGYHDDPARTVQVTRDLWFHTGDRGRFDSGGELWFTGRDEDVIRRFGEFIAASDVEEAFSAHAAVEQAAAVGIDSEVVGQEVLVIVTLRDPGSVGPRELWEWSRDRLPRQAVPRFVDVRTELPLTATGKVQKHVLRETGPTSTTFDAREEHAHKDGTS